MSVNSHSELEFSKKYNQQHAEHYLQKHQDGFLRKLSNWREQSISRKALAKANDPILVLDLPSGAGRFWPLLCEHPHRNILAADNSRDMLNVALTAHPESITARVSTFQTSAFNIKLTENQVDCIFCIRLLHHIPTRQQRLQILNEFHRVTRDTVIVSLWVDGNYQAWKRKRLEKKRAQLNPESANQNRFIVDAKSIENEFSTAGFSIMEKLDFLPWHSMWRTYVLKKDA